MKRENRLVLLSSLQKRTEDEIREVFELMENELDWGYIIGQLIHHRLSGYFIAYVPSDLKKYIFKEVDKQLSFIYKTNKVITTSNMDFMQEVFYEFEEEKVVYAGLKGVIYNASVYEIGVRRSNDTDILVPEPELQKVDEILRRKGFIQSVNSNRDEATRREKIIQRMNFHDLIPYYKNVNDSLLVPYYKIDINFRVDNEKEGLTKKLFDYGTEIYSQNGYNVRGLKWATHLLHLCIHFYREASHSIWVKDKRDCMLYKLIDIENTIRYLGVEKLQTWLDEIRKFGCDRDIFFTFYYLNQVYPNDIYMKLMKTTNAEYEVDEFTIVGTNENVKREKAYIEEAFDLRYCIDFSKK